MIRLIDDLDWLERLSLIDISYSRLDTLGRCKAKYFYSYVQQEERKFGAPASLGKMVHQVLENVDWTEPLNLMELHKDLEAVRPEHDPEGLVEDILIDAGHAMLTEYYDRHGDETFDVIAVELPFCIVVGRGLISGYIDRVERTSNGLLLCDWKSGRWEVAQKNIPTNLQLGIYALALSLLYPGEHIYGELYYLRSGRRKGYAFTSEDLIRIEQELLESVDALIETNSFGYTDAVRECYMCDFTQICPVGKKRMRQS